MGDYSTSFHFLYAETVSYYLDFLYVYNYNEQKEIEIYQHFLFNHIIYADSILQGQHIDPEQEIIMKKHNFTALSMISNAIGFSSILLILENHFKKTNNQKRLNNIKRNQFPCLLMSLFGAWLWGKKVETLYETNKLTSMMLAPYIKENN